MNISNSKSIRTRDDSSFAELIAQVRTQMREEGIQEKYVPWHELARSGKQPNWNDVSSGTDLIKRLAEPIRLFFESTNLFVISGPDPILALATRGEGLSGEGLSGELMGSSDTVREWNLPEEEGVPAIRLHICRRDRGQVTLHCSLLDSKVAPEQVGIEVFDALSGDKFLLGCLADFLTADIILPLGKSTLRLTFKHTKPDIIREIPFEIDALPDS